MGGGLFACGCCTRAAPDQGGFTLAGKSGPIFLPFSRIGFWTCTLAALTVTALVVGRSLPADIGGSSAR
jgi:hypothetical protein